MTAQRLPNPSTVRVGLKRDGRIALHQGAVDIGQGSNTVVTQICADALGAPVDEREDQEDGVHVRARLPHREVRRFARFLVAEARVEPVRRAR